MVDPKPIVGTNLKTGWQSIETPIYTHIQILVQKHSEFTYWHILDSGKKPENPGESHSAMEKHVELNTISWAQDHT